MITLIILLGILSAWREVEILIQRGSWRKEDYRNVFWETDWKTWKKNLDSFHISGGLIVVVMSLSFYFIKLDSIWYTPLAWLFFFYIRNIGLHIIFKRKPIYSYLYKFWR